MSGLTFFKHFKQTMGNLEIQAENLHNAGDVNRLIEISNQLKLLLNEYKQLMQNSFDLLWKKRNEYNQLLAYCLNLPPLDFAQYKSINQKSRQLECDIKALSNFLQHEEPQQTLEYYEIKLQSIHHRINILQQGSTFTP